MASLKAAAALLALAIASPGRAESVGDWTSAITEASYRFGIPAAWIERVMRAESNGQTRLNGRPIRSPAGAIGLMQLMPDTWESVRLKLGLGTNPDDPRDNILAGTFFLRMMYDRFGYPGLFAAYHAGPGRFSEYLATGRTLPRETIVYLNSIVGRGKIASDATAEPPRDMLFAVRRENSLPPVSQGSAARAATLFVRHDNVP